MTNRRDRKLWRLRIVFALVATTFGVLIVFSGSQRRKYDDAQLQQVVEGLRAGATTMPFDGRLILTGGDARLSDDGIAYLTGRPVTHALFPTWRGPGTRLAGHLWSEATLKEGDEPSVLVPRTPKPDEPAASSTFAPTTMRAVRVTKVRRPGWYEVTRQDD